MKKLPTLVLCILIALPVAAQQPGAGEMSVSAMLTKASEFEKQGNNDSAIAVLKDALEKEPKNSQVLVRLGLAFHKAARFDDAVDALRKAVEVKPTDAFSHYALCRALIRADRRSQAPDACKEAIRLDPKNPEFQKQLALVNALDTRALESLTVLQSLLEKFANDIEVIEAIADFHYARSEYSNAIEYYQRLTQIAPRYSRPFFMLARANDHLEKSDEAIRFARKYLEMMPGDRLGEFLLGEVLQNAGFYDESIMRLVKASQLDPKNGSIYRFLAKSYAAIGDKEKSLGSLRHAYQYLPPDLNTSYQLGRALIEHGDMAEAVPPLERANQLRKNEWSIMLQLGLAYFESNNFDKAIEILTAADALKPGSDTLEMYLRVTRARRDILTNFQQVLNQAREQPGDLMGRRRLAAAYRFKGQWADAEREHLAMIKENPNLWEVYSDAAIFYGDTGHIAESVTFHQKVFGLRPHWVTQYSIASHLKTLGKIDEGIMALRKGIEIAPDKAELWIDLSHMLEIQGKRDEAYKASLKAFELAPADAVTNFRLAWHYIRIGNKESALQHYGVVKGVSPDDAVFLRKAIRAYFRITVE